MIANNQLRPPNVGRRALGVAVCSLPALLLLASIGFGIARDRPSWFAGIGFMIAACIFAVFNRELGALGYPGYPPGGSPPSSSPGALPAPGAGLSPASSKVSTAYCPVPSYENVSVSSFSHIFIQPLRSFSFSRRFLLVAGRAVFVADLLEPPRRIKDRLSDGCLGVDVAVVVLEIERFC